MPILLEINIIPTGKEFASLSNGLSDVLNIVEECNIEYQLRPIGTVLEGELDTLLEVARQMHKACFGQGYPRVVTSIRIDDRRDKYVDMQHNTEAVEDKLDRQR